jgi:hypothetical protein
MSEGSRLVEWPVESIHKRVLARDKYKCYDCEGPADRVLYLKPRSLGGTHHPKNLAAICGSCEAEREQDEQVQCTTSVEWQGEGEAMPEQADTLEWLDAPPTSTRGALNASMFAPVREQLKAQPGRWARLTATEADQTAARSLVMRMRYPGYRFAYRKADDGYGIYGRYDEQARTEP